MTQRAQSGAQVWADPLPTCGAQNKLEGPREEEEEGPRSVCVMPQNCIWPGTLPAAGLAWSPVSGWRWGGIPDGAGQAFSPSARAHASPASPRTHCRGVFGGRRLPACLLSGPSPHSAQETCRGAQDRAAARRGTGFQGLALLRGLPSRSALLGLWSWGCGRGRSGPSESEDPAHCPWGRVRWSPASRPCRPS